MAETHRDAEVSSGVSSGVSPGASPGASPGPRIARLPPLVANRIAAGEVVQRPGSVVKELVENSLDAGARRVQIRLEDGGRRRIQVIDDGCGMGPEDASLAFARHATSKITDAADLNRVQSFGFRGEALASIASVARVSMRTRRACDELGVLVRGEATDALSSSPVSCGVGTDLSIEDLFARVPARLKFLRTASTELGHIARLVDAVALADPGLHISLHNGARCVCDHRPQADRMARARAVFGPRVADRLYEVRGAGDYAVWGALSEPSLRRRGASGLVLLISGRVVRDRTLQHAILQAYGPLLDRGMGPVGVLEVRCPPGTVDVNVHPAKTEVRFVSSQAVHAAVGAAVRAMIAGTPWLDDAARGRRPAPPPAEASPSGAPRADAGEGAVSGVGERVEPGGWPSPPSWQPSARRPHARRPSAPPVAGDRREHPAPCSSPLPPGQDPLPALAPRGPWARLRYIGQAGRCFLLFDSDDALVILDQHAAHERVLFERFVRAFRRGGMASQRLLIPRIVHMSPEEAACLLEHGDISGPLGFELEGAGDRALMVRAYPQVLAPEKVEDEVRALAGSLQEGGHGEETAAALERHAATLACHAAMRAGDLVDASEVARLLSDLEDLELAGYCPHGRPALMRAPFDEIGRWFHRS